MVNRDEIVRVSNDYYLKGSLQIKDAIELIQEYSKEFGKKDTDIDNLVKILVQTNIINSFFEDALEHYEKKFNVVKVYTALDTINTPFNNRKLILIF